jgi:hypothetical protein
VDEPAAIDHPVVHHRIEQEGVFVRRVRRTRAEEAQDDEDILGNIRAGWVFYTIVSICRGPLPIADGSRYGPSSHEHEMERACDQAFERYWQDGPGDYL